MKREKGKVPTNVNKDRIATGNVTNGVQIVNEGSKTQQSFLSSRIAERANQEKVQKSLKPEILKQQQIENAKIVRQQKHKEFTKRLENEREK